MHFHATQKTCHNQPDFMLPLINSAWRCKIGLFKKQGTLHPKILIGFDLAPFKIGRIEE